MEKVRLREPFHGNTDARMPQPHGKKTAVVSESLTLPLESVLADTLIGRTQLGCRAAEFESELRSSRQSGPECKRAYIGAGDGIRTRDINLGKVALYQLSYSRSGRVNHILL